MKRAIFIVAVLFFSIPIFSQVTADDLVGEWTYAVSTDQGDLTGKLYFTKSNNQLEGTVFADDGTRMKMKKLEIKEDSKIYFEVTPEYEVFKVTLKVDGKKLSGFGGLSGQDFSITGARKK